MNCVCGRGLYHRHYPREHYLCKNINCGYKYYVPKDLKNVVIDNISMLKLKLPEGLE